LAIVLSVLLRYTYFQTILKGHGTISSITVQTQVYAKTTSEAYQYAEIKLENMLVILHGNEKGIKDML